MCNVAQHKLPEAQRKIHRKRGVCKRYVCTVGHVEGEKRQSNETDLVSCKWLVREQTAHLCVYGTPSVKCQASWCLVFRPPAPAPGTNARTRTTSGDCLPDRTSWTKYLIDAPSISSYPALPPDLAFCYYSNDRNDQRETSLDCHRAGIHCDVESKRVAESHASTIYTHSTGTLTARLPPQLRSYCDDLPVPTRQRLATLDLTTNPAAVAVHRG